MSKELYSSEGLLALINCLNELIDISGKRRQLINMSKDSVVSTYEIAQNHLPIEVINEQLKITNQKLFSLRVSGKCNLSISKSCLKLCPNQLTIDEQILIREYLSKSDYKDLPLNHIWAEAQRNGLYVSKTTFYKYVRQIKGKVDSKIEDLEHEIQRKTVSAKRVFEILHMDSTTFKCLNGERVYVHFVMDNFSRTILGAVTSHSSKSIVVANNLLEVISKFQLEKIPFELYCDDGPENHGFVNDLISTGKVKITKIVANFSTQKSNNMIEVWNKKFKQVILKKFKAKSFENLKVELPNMVDYFNNLKLPVLRTLTPNEVIKGATYEDLQVKFKMEEAKLKRLVQNKMMNCHLSSSLNDKNYNCKSLRINN